MNDESGPADVAGGVDEEAPGPGWDEAEAASTEAQSPEAQSPETQSPETQSPVPDASPTGSSPQQGASPEIGGPSASPPASSGSGELGSGPDSVVHPRLWQRHVAVLREQGHRRLRWVMGGVVVLVVLCVALLVLHTPLLALRHATVRGAAAHRLRSRAPGGGLARSPPAHRRRSEEPRQPISRSCRGWRTPWWRGTGPTA